MELLTRAQILKVEDLPRELVDVPEWGGSVWVRTMSGTERDTYEESLIHRQGETVSLCMVNARAKVCASSICDDKGERLFSDEDVISLGHKSGAALERVFSVARRLSRLNDSELEETAKNSEATDASDSE